MSLAGTKTLLASTTVRGIILSVLAVIGGAFGYSFTDGDAQTLVEVISGALTLVGQGIALYGRVKATKKIG